MRLVPLVGLALLLASGPVFAQQNALTPAQADCPPGEPDTLQISWTQPCDSGGWLFDKQAGCRMWDWHPAPEDPVVWRGACHGQLPNGQGEAQWFEHGRPIDRFIGTFRNGKRDGEGHYIWNHNVRFDGNYANDVPQGYGIARIENEVLAGEWDKGCISARGKVAAIGVPRTSCGPDNGKRLKKSLSAELARVLGMARRIPDRHRKAVQRSDPPIPLLWVASFYFAGRRAHSGGESIVFADVNFALVLARLVLKASAVSAIL